MPDLFDLVDRAGWRCLSRRAVDEGPAMKGSIVSRE
jgi:hypothetical protein